MCLTIFYRRWRSLVLHHLVANNDWLYNSPNRSNLLVHFVLNCVMSVSGFPLRMEAGSVELSECSIKHSGLWYKLSTVPTNAILLYELFHYGKKEKFEGVCGKSSELPVTNICFCLREKKSITKMSLIIQYFERTFYSAYSSQWSSSVWINEGCWVLWIW